MIIKHNNSQAYNLNFRLYSLGYNGGLDCLSFAEFDAFEKAIKESYPEVDFSDYVTKYHELVNELTLLAAETNFNYNRKENYFCVAVINNEVIYSSYPNLIGSLVRDKVEAWKRYSEGFITKIITYGWNYKLVGNGNVHRVDYYSMCDDKTAPTYPIYVFNNKLILSNADKTKPTILYGKDYFLYNDGKKGNKDGK